MVNQSHQRSQIDHFYKNILVLHYILLTEYKHVKLQLRMTLTVTYIFLINYMHALYFLHYFYSTGLWKGIPLWTLARPFKLDLVDNIILGNVFSSFKVKYCCSSYMYQGT